MSFEQVRFGSHKLPRPPDFDQEAIQTRALNMLARCLNLHTTVAVVGAGCSIPLGYEGWTGFASSFLEKTIQVLKNCGDSKHKDLEQLQRHLASIIENERKGIGVGPDASTLMYFVGVCKRSLQNHSLSCTGLHEKEDPFEKILSELFDPKSKNPIAPSPYPEILRLPIWRIVTTNYDHEIERAIKDQGDNSKTLTQEVRHTDALTRFALADVPMPNDTRYTVFHCHGEYSVPDSIIADEADYQRWYLGRRKEVGSVFQHTIELLFASNPLLFLGYGLRDEDLLRPLRVIGATNRDRKESRPIFALMPSEQEEDRYRQQHYYERYGLHVISYDVKPGTNKKKRTEAFCAKLREVREHWFEAQDEWHYKPPPRLVAVPSEKSNQFPPTNWPALGHIKVPVEEGQNTIERLQNSLTADSPPSVIGFLGPSGCGKTLQILKVMGLLRQQEQMEHNPFPDGYFYWNAHYQNEGLTGIDHLLLFLQPDTNPEGDRAETLEKLLRQKKALIVIDGAERLFQAAAQPLIGVPINAYVNKMLDLFAHEENRSTVVLVGRRWPEKFESASGQHSSKMSCEKVSVSRLRREDLLPFLDEVQLDHLKAHQHRLSALCSLLRGHNYGLLLALELVNSRVPSNGSMDQIDREFGDIQRVLVKARIDNRLWRVIRITMDDLDQRTPDQYTPGFTRQVLKYLSFSLSGVCYRTLKIIFELVAESMPSSHELPKFDDFLERLERRHMIKVLLKAHLLDISEADEPDQVRDKSSLTYAIHSKVREFFHITESTPAERLPALDLGGVSSGSHGVDPGSNEDSTILKSLFFRIVESASHALANGEQQAASDLCRDAYGLIRTSMEANTAPRWTDFASYSEIGIRLAQLAKKLGGETCWDHRETLDDWGSGHESWRGCLFIGEMAWLYNDVGLALFNEGLISDAYAVWEQAFSISRIIEQDDVHGGNYQIQILLNLSYSFLELGRLASAKAYLARAEGMNRILEDPSFGARILGLKGLLYHLNGNLREAQFCYAKAIRYLKGTEDFRGKSTFYKHRADLLLVQGKLKQAEADIRAASIFADEGRYPDLVIEAQMSRGRLFAKREEWSEARLQYDAALRGSRRIQSRRLEAAVLGNLARLAYEQGDNGGARYNAMRSLKIANELRLGLRVSHSLVVLGRATLDAGHQDLGVSYLKQAKLLAEEQHYWFRAREAEMELGKLGEE